MERSPSTHRLMIELGRNQFGIVTRKQLIEAGFSSSLVDHHLANGLLWPVFRGVYSVGRPVERQKSIWMAATLAGGSGSVLAGLSAAEYWGIIGHRNLVEVNRAHGRNRVMVGRSIRGQFRLYLRTRRNPVDLTACPNGIPVRSVVGTLIDLAAVLPDRQLEAAISEASRLGLLGVEQVDQIHEFGFAREGIGRLRKHLRWWSPETVNVLSVLEGMFQRICREHSIETPKLNRRVCGLKVDFLWPEQRVVVETDGFTFHGDLVSFKRDHERQARLARGGYLRLAFTYWQVTETPEDVIEAVVAGLDTWNPRTRSLSQRSGSSLSID